MLSLSFPFPFLIAGIKLLKSQQNGEHEENRLANKKGLLMLW